MTHLPSGSLTAGPWKVTFSTGAMLNFGGVLFWGGSSKHKFPTKLHQRVVLWYSTVHLCFELQHHRHPEKIHHSRMQFRSFSELRHAWNDQLNLIFGVIEAQETAMKILELPSNHGNVRVHPPPLCHTPGHKALLKKLLTSMIPKYSLTLGGGTLKFPWIHKAPGWPTIAL